MLEMEQAIDKARQVLPRAYPESTSQELRLEAVEKTDNEQFWHVTFSYPSVNWTPIQHVREYRTVKLKADDGELMGVRNGYLTAA